MPFDLDRFIAAQDTGAFDAAVDELRRGQKTPPRVSASPGMGGGNWNLGGPPR